MKKKYLILIFCLSSVFLFGQKKQWTIAANNGQEIVQQKKMVRNDMPKEYTIYNLKFKDFNNSIAVLKNKKKEIIEIPTSNGIQKFHIEESSNFSEELAKKFPEIKSFTGTQVDNPSIKTKFSSGLDGLHFAIYEVGKPTYYVDSYTKDNQSFIAYKRTELNKEIQDFSCEVEDKNNVVLSQIKNKRANANDGVLRTYKLALACTGEYAQFQLNRLGISSSATENVKKTAITSAMNTTVNRINGVFERDLSVRFELVNNNDQLIFLDANTDNLSNDNDSSLINESQNICDSVIGDSNYDIGHTFSTGAGGRAALGSVCITGQKGQGVTGKPSPFGDSFDIDYVAHEIGHQMGGNHTFNGTEGNCSGGNRNNATAVEPGSGSSIMAYAGICSPQNIQNSSNDHFHSVSITEMWSIIQSTGSCATTTSTGNNAPTANAGLDYSIPKSTPFVLRGTGTDIDAGNVLTYNWEQIDNQIGFAIPPISTNSGGAMFKSLSSSLSPNRYMPALATVISGNTSSTWEVIPSVARNLNFSLVVRDNNNGGGGSAKDEVEITVVNSAPFIISSQNTATTWDTETSQTITWNVGDTNIAPINCQLINVKLSTDGGITFPILLASGIANDGSYTFNVPENATTNARIMVEAADNIFYDVNNADIIINSTMPNFVLENKSEIGAVCNTGNETVSYNLEVNFINGFSENVSFTASGEPLNSIVTFSPTTVNSDNTVVMQIANLNGAIAQDYTINVVATSNSITQNIDVDLKVYSDVFSAQTLATPLDGATGVFLTPTLNWNANSNASSYEIQVASDVSFTGIISSGVSTNTSFKIPVTLNDITTYYWRVKPKNNCDEGVFSDVFSFTTEVCSICTSVADTTYETSTTLVKLNTINNPSAKPSGYSDYKNLTTDIKRDVAYDLTVNANTADFGNATFSTQTVVWIDWNQNCSFDDDGEEYNLGTTIGSVDGATSQSPLSIVVPTGALLGNTIMRVTTKYSDDGLPTSCENDADAEVEDYTLNIVDNSAAIENVTFKGFKLFPNPTKGNFNLQFDVINSDEVAIQLYDIRGRLVGEKKYFDTSATFSETISFNQTAAGLYLLRIINGDIQTTRKLIVE